MSNKPHIKLVSAIFSAFMALVYTGIGLFLVFGDKKFMTQMVNPALLVIFGIMLFLMGALRGLRAYQLFNIYRDAK